MFIKWDNETRGFQLPVNPETYMLNGKQQNTSVNIHATGELNLKGKRGLNTLQIASFFPNQIYDFLRTLPLSPMEYVNQLTEALNKNATVHIVFGSTINMFATIETFNWGEEESNGDIKYDISFKEYSDGGRSSKSVGSISYTWKKGDTWKKVCQKQLGDASLAKKNQKANKKVIDKAKKAYKKKNKKVKKVKEETALIGYKVVLKK